MSQHHRGLKGHHLHMVANTLPEDLVLRRLIDRIQALASRFILINYFHILQKLNGLVDSKANQACHVTLGKMVQKGGRGGIHHPLIFLPMSWLTNILMQWDRRRSLHNMQSPRLMQALLYIVIHVAWRIGIMNGLGELLSPACGFILLVSMSTWSFQEPFI